jgi:predicted dehydrogenase
MAGAGTTVTHAQPAGGAGGGVIGREQATEKQEERTAAAQRRSENDLVVENEALCLPHPDDSLGVSAPVRFISPTVIQAGVIGLGVGAQHAAAYEAHSRARLAVLCDTSLAVSRSVGRQFPAARRTTNWREVIDDPDVDVVSICTYDNQHAEQVLAAIRAGKHVFVEKPMCLTVDEARAIRAALKIATSASRGTLVLSSNLPLRLSPRFLRVRSMIERGDLGEIYHVEADYFYGRLSKLTDGWRGRIPQYSVVLGGAVHMIDLVLWLTGGHVENVTAIGSNIASRRSGLAINDHVIALLHFSNGMTAKVSANFGCVRPHDHGLSVFGTKATFTSAPAAAYGSSCGGVLFTSRDPSALPILIDDPHPGAGKGDQISAFVAAALGQGTPIVSVEDVFRTMCVCLAVDRSAREGRPVTVEYV